jgi:serine/threonine transporter
MKTIKKILQEWTSTSLVLRIVIGLVIGVALGLAAPEWTAVGLLGQVFLNALKGIAPVLVFVLVASSIARAHGGLGSRVRSLISCYLLNTFWRQFWPWWAVFCFPSRSNWA